jgi:hypothetical protein
MLKTHSTNSFYSYLYYILKYSYIVLLARKYPILSILLIVGAALYLSTDTILLLLKLYKYRTSLCA